MMQQMDCSAEAYILRYVDLGQVATLNLESILSSEV